MKRCAACSVEKPLEDFHRQPSGKDGRHTYCKVCFNARYRGHRRRIIPRGVKREQNFKRRYGITSNQVEALLASQNGRCAICVTDITTQRYCVDHDHRTRRVRGILCHRCNLLIAVLDQPILEKAIAYVGAA